MKVKRILNPATKTPSRKGLFPRPFWVLTTILCLISTVCWADLFPVSVERGARTTVTGDRLAYDLFIPQSGPGLPEGPYPAVILTHGFARNRTFHENNALYMAERGIVVLTPDMSSLIRGEKAQLKNIDNTVDHVKWLITRSATPGDPLFNLIDSHAVGLAGHSAGGAISFEAAIQTQSLDVPVAALCLLDAVPYDRTWQLAPSLKVPRFCSLRSEPGSCNSYGNVVDTLQHLSFPAADVRVVHATHVDPENPTDLFGSLFCGGTNEARRAIYQRLMYLFFQDAFHLQSVESPDETYAGVLARYHIKDKVEIRSCGMETPAPSAPYLSMTIVGLEVTFAWTAQDHADGYLFLYAPAPYTGPESIISLPMGEGTSLTATLWEGAALYAAVKAYNAYGSSDFSNIVHLVLDVPSGSTCSQPAGFQESLQPDR